jgi:hypothetical protein
LPAPCTLVERLPTVEEYMRLITVVGFRPRRREAIELALRHSWFSVCAESAGYSRFHRYLTDVTVIITRADRSLSSMCYLRS